MVTINQLNHPPGKVIQKLLIDLGHATSVASAGSWPVHYSNMPDSPDNCVLVTDTAGMNESRDMVDRNRTTHYGFQVRVRSASVVDGYKKCQQISVAFDRDVYRTDVVLDGDTYAIQAITRTSPVMAVGPEVGVARRYFHTVNATVTLQLIDETGTGT